MNKLALQITNIKTNFRGGRSAGSGSDGEVSTNPVGVSHLALPAIITTDVDGSAGGPSGSGESTDESVFSPTSPTSPTRRSCFKRDRQSPAASTSSGGGGGGNNHKVTAMLLLVSFAFLVTAVPVTIIQIFFFHIQAEYMKKHQEAAESGDSPVPLETERLYAKVLLATAIGRVLAYGNHASNFFLYCISGQKFRDEVRHLWWGSSRRRRMRHRRQLTYMQHCSSSSSSSQKFLIRPENSSASCVHIPTSNEKNSNKMADL